MLSYKMFTFNPVSENTYLVYDDLGNTLIIDPGCYFAEEKQELADFLQVNNLKPVQLINTHCHLDHVFGNKWVHDTYGLELYLHPNEEKVLLYAPVSGNNWGLPFDNYSGPLHFITEKNKISLGQHYLDIKFTPGHSPGSICLYSEESKFVIGGDVLFKEGIGRTDLPGGNYEQLLASIREQLFSLPNDVTVLSGHGPSTTIGHEKQHNPFLK